MALRTTDTTTGTMAIGFTAIIATIITNIAIKLG
jgi:hypothetical protein